MTQLQPLKIGLVPFEDRYHPQQRPEGFVQVDINDAWSWSKFIWGLIALISGNLLILFLLKAMSEYQNTKALWALSVVLVIGLCGLGLFIRGVLVTSKLQAGEIVMSRFPLRMGEELKIKYRRQLRRGQILSPGEISATLIAYDWIKYNVGTDTRTETATIWEQSFPTREVPSGLSKVEYDFPIKIPLEGPPSFEATSSKVIWELRVTLKLPGIPKDDSSFRLIVVPEVVS
jgi:hypothetical protein